MLSLVQSNLESLAEQSACNSLRGAPRNLPGSSWGKQAGESLLLYSFLSLSSWQFRGPTAKFKHHSRVKNTRHVSCFTGFHMQELRCYRCSPEQEFLWCRWFYTDIGVNTASVITIFIFQSNTLYSYSGRRVEIRQYCIFISLIGKQLS